MIHRRLLAALAFAAPLAAMAAQAATNFRDIPPGHWARKPAGILAEHKIMPGRTPVDFAGEVPITRYELAEVLSELYNVEGPSPTFNILKDMPPGHPMTLQVQRVIGYELLAPRKPGVFDGDETPSRKEVAEALDTLLNKNGVAPPARRRNPVFFTDVPASSKLGAVLDRVVNRYALIDAKAGSAFYPTNAVTRFQVLAMLLKAMPYLNPQVDREIREATRPTPPPSPSPLPSGVSPPPATPTPEVSEWPSYAPETPTPSPVPTLMVPSGGPLLRTHGRAQGEVLLTYGEDLPTEPGAIVAGERPQFSGGMLPGGGARGELWGPNAGVGAAVTSYLVGFDVPNGGKNVAIDMLDTFVQLNGWFKVGAGPNWELAFGGVGAYRKTYNLTGKLIGQYYLTADKDYFGAGPAVLLGNRLNPDLDLLTQIAVYPMLQAYNLPRASKSLPRWAADTSVRGVYRLGGGFSLEGGIHAYLSGAFSGGSQTMLGATLGGSMEF